MKTRLYKIVTLCFIFFTSIPYCFSQITISKDELPSKLGTKLTYLHDTTEHAIVDVGSPGENQIWNFTQSISGIEVTNEVVDLNSTPFAADFPTSNWVIKYSDGLLDMIYSDIFPQIKGDVYFYQQFTDTDAKILGTGFVSSFVSGAALFDPPNVILELVPTQYGDTWETNSNFSISKDTTISGDPGTFTLAVHDTAYNFIDGWGKVTIPLGTFDCLRMKSYVFMDEKVSFNGIPITTKKTRIINYNWLVEEIGLLVRVASHTGEQNDNFTDARLFTRLDKVGALPVEMFFLKSEVLDNSVRLTWKTESEENNLGFEIKRRKTGGDFEKVGFIKGFGTTHNPKNYEFVDPNLKPGKYQYRLKQIDMDGSFSLSEIVDVDVHVPQVLSLEQNYPNPFNPETVISFKLSKMGNVSLKIYNLLGEEIRNLENGFKEIGEYHVYWNGRDDNGMIMPTGVYIYQLNFSGSAGGGFGKDFVIKRKMIFIQ